MPFLEILVAQGIIKDTQVAEIIRRAEEHHEGDVDLALAEFGLTEAQILQLKSTYFNIPIKEINPRTISLDTLKNILDDSAKHYKIVALGITEGVLEVGIVNPDNIQATDALQFIINKLGLPFKYYLISTQQFKEIVKNYSGVSGEVDQAMSELDTEIAQVNTAETLDAESKNPQEKLKPGEEEKIVEDAPIIKIVAVILRHATEGNASDIHIENTGDQVKVRFRVDGTLHTSLVLPLNVYAGIVARIKILSKLRLDEKRKPQDGGFSTKIEGRKIDFRVSTFPTYYGEKIMMRILD
jgi:type IV pilus assembly protein PilB